MESVEEIIIPGASSGSIRTKQRWTTCTFWITVGVTVQVRVSYACICSELWRLLFACLRTESLRKFWITLLHLSSEFLPLHLPVLLWYSNRMGAHELRHVTVTGLASDSSVQVITRKKKTPIYFIKKWALVPLPPQLLVACISSFCHICWRLSPPH